MSNIEKYMQTDYKELILDLINDFEKKFFEREELIRLSLLFLISGQNLFLIGVPGVGKTEFCRLLFTVVEDAVFWEIQFSDGTEEKDLIEEDLESETSITKAHYIYFDEMYKAKPELLNKLLSFLNEGYLTINGQAYEVEKKSVFGASNELCTSVVAEPFVDRFPGTIEVKRIQDRENKEKYIKKEFDRTKTLSRYLVLDEIDWLVEQSKNILMPQSFSDKYLTLMEKTVSEGLKCSDRKFGNAIDLLKMSALLNNRDALDNSDLFIMKHIAWSNYIERTNVDRILGQIMFGNKIEIEDMLKNIELEVVRIVSLKDSDYRDLLEYKLEFSGRDKINIFEAKKDGVEQLQYYFSLQLDNLSEVFNRYNEVIETEKQINKNIFLIGIRNKVFTNDIIVKMEKLFELIRSNKELIDTWLLENRILYNYEVRYFEED
jgi:MoxR-like ATPase